MPGRKVGSRPIMCVEFNCNLDLATVTSRYVAKVLRDNGVRAPIRVIGDGIDQITRLDSAKHETEWRAKIRHW